MGHPEVAYRSCTDCAAWLYDEKTGKKLERNGEPLKRPKGIPTPCYQCPKESPTAGKELSERNRKAYEHYRTCRAVGSFPRDPIVERNARLIREVEERYEQHERQVMLLLAARKR